MVKYRSLMAIQLKKRSLKAMRRSRGVRRNKRQKRDDYGIPFDLIVEILTRLPAKSLMRFKCVSKLWSRLIRSRYFCNLHLTVASSSRPPLRLYMSLVEHNMCDSMECCHNPGKSELLTLRLSLSSSNRTESSLESDMTFPGIGGRKMVVLRGLILYTVCRKVCIYNPATRQSLTLPAVKSNIFAHQELNKHVNYFFGHDPVHDQYKVVCSVVVYSEVRKKITFESWVFVLEPKGFWRKIEYDQPHLPTREGICINGVIYYLAFNHTCCDNVYCFDVRSEEFRSIKGPHEVSEYAKLLGFIEHGGKPAIYDFTHIRETGVSELWVLEVDGGTWSRKSLVLKPCQRHLMDDIINIMDLRVRGTSQDNEVILALPSACYLLYYDLIENDLRKFNIIEMPPDHRLYVYVKVMDMCENIMHLEL